MEPVGGSPRHTHVADLGVGMMRRLTALLVALALTLVACGDQVTGDPAAAGSELARCDEIERAEAPEDRYADEPVYVANEMPVEQVRDWAADQPGFADVWIDRERNGWVTVAFTENVAARQAEIDERFPDDGVVAVEVERTREELERLQDRVHSELSFPHGSGSDVTRGAVMINVGELTEERLDEVAERFGDEPVCVEGADPADVAEGPQQTEGDGWWLLASEKDAGQPYRTGIATDEASYVDLWEEAGVAEDRPEVDFETEVAIWFGAVYSSGGCDDLRLDDVVVDREAALVHADIVTLGSPPGCNDDANPHAFLVAVPRDRLPEGGFALQLGASEPPPGVPEERTMVEADLTEPGAVADPEDLRQATIEDLDSEPGLLQPGDIAEPGFPMPYKLYVHCGADWLGPLNDVMWRTDEIEPGQVPDAWADAVDDTEHIVLTVEIDTEPARLTAEAGGHTVIYEPTNEDPPGCD